MKFPTLRFTNSPTFKLLSRSFREGSVQLWRNKFLSGTTIGLGALILTLLNFVFAVQFFADDSLRQLETRADFSVPLREDFDTFEFDALKNELKQFEITTDLRPAERFDNFSVPPRLHVKFQNLSEAEPVLEIFKKSRYTEVIGDWDGVGERDFVNVIGKLLVLRRNVEKAALVLILLFLGGGILLVVNTFRIVLFSRRNEIFIARLVGAKPNFIMGPFIVEGVLLGIASAVLAIMIFVLVLREVSVLPGGDIFLYMWNNVFSLEILAAGMVGGVGAWWSVRRYLFGKFEK